MPLNKTCSIEAFQQNISEEIKSGRPREQAVAIAASTLRSACKEEGKPMPISQTEKSINKTIQSIIFEKEEFQTITDVQAWLINNGITAKEILDAENQFRATIVDAIDFSDNTFEIMTYSPTVEMITGELSQSSAMRIQKAASKKERTREFLESALARAKKLMNPRDYAVIFQAARASAGGKVAAKRRKEKKDGICKKATFVIGEHSPLESARDDAFVGDDGITFKNKYLDKLGLSKDECVFKFLDNLDDEFSPQDGLPVIAIGKTAKDFLKSVGIECFSLPHPSAIRHRGDRGEITRKCKKISKALEKYRENGESGASEKAERDSEPLNKVAEVISKSKKVGHTQVEIAKSMDEKQIVYGVVLDPYKVDLQGDWVPPAEIESTAHGFLKKSRVIGFEHMQRADAQIVESWVEPYPTKQDYQMALQNMPHKVYRRKFGLDFIHSGSWVAGVQLGDKEWEMFRNGELNAFSVGGFSFKTRVSSASMPEIEFVEVEGMDV